MLVSDRHGDLHTHRYPSIRGIYDNGISTTLYRGLHNRGTEEPCEGGGGGGWEGGANRASVP